MLQVYADEHTLFAQVSYHLACCLGQRTDCAGTKPVHLCYGSSYCIHQAVYGEKILLHFLSRKLQAQNSGKNDYGVHVCLQKN